MEYRRVGRSGLKISALSIGGWLTFGTRLDDEATAAILEAAVEAGVNFIDLADVYGPGGAAERAVGRALPRFERRRLVISSKCYWPSGDGPNDRGLSRKHIVESCEASLRRLGTDYLDLYFCHRADPDTPLAETARAMDDLIRQGKVLYWGTSCWEAARLRETHALTERRGFDGPIVEQPRYNLLKREIEADVLPTCAELGMGVVAWSPLEGGLLTGKYDHGVPEGSRADTTSWLDEMLTEENRARLRGLSALAAERGCAPAQLALAWVLGRPGVTSVITGASRVEQLAQNLGALELRLDADARARLDALFGGPGP